MNAPDKIVAQHNALVNARFTFDPLQMRLFLALLGRIGFDDVDFQKYLIPFQELVGKPSGSSYALIKEMCQKLTSFSLYIEDLEPVTRRRSKKPAYRYIPLMAEASYAPEQSGVVAIFNPLIMPYLLQLRESGNFTLAKLAELGKLKSAYALRIYWLLKEYAAFGERTITLQQLRFLLDIADKEYPRFSSLKARILGPVQKELAGTDVAFTFELARRNKIVEQIKFIIDQARPVKVLKLPVPAASPVLTTHPGYPEKLQAAGLRPTAVREVLTQLTAEEYPAGYVDFVLARVGKQHGLGKIKNPAGAVYKALREKYLLPEYRAGLLASVPTKRAVGATPGRTTKAVRETFTMPEVRLAYDESAAFRQAQGSAETWEQYLARVYYAQGFTLEDFHGRQCLVLR